MGATSAERERRQRCSVRPPLMSAISKRVHRHIAQSCCPWNVKFSHELAKDSPFRAREPIAGKNSLTLARDILAFDQAALRVAFGKSPMKRATLRGMQRNASVVTGNLDTLDQQSHVSASAPAAGPRLHER